MGSAGVNKNYVDKLIVDIESAISEVLGYSSKPYEELSGAEKYAIRYNIIVLVEALVALAIHLARRAFNKEPETPVHALRILRDEGLLTPGEYDELVKLVRLFRIYIIFNYFWGALVPGPLNAVSIGRNIRVETHECHGDPGVPRTAARNRGEGLQGEA